MSPSKTDLEPEVQTLQTTNGDNDSKSTSIVTGIPEADWTITKPPFIPGPDYPIKEGGLGRVNIAPTKESPNGTTENNFAETHQHQTVLEQHCEYFDRDRDGIIWPYDTYVAVRGWGWSTPLSIFTTLFIHLGLSYMTLPPSFHYLPDPYFRLYTNRMHHAKHGSSSMTYDHQGRFRPQLFEDIFAKYDHEGKGSLTYGDILNFWNSQRMAFDFFGATATLAEWSATYLLIWPEDGKMKKEDVRGIFDGSLFYKKAEVYREKKLMLEEKRKGKKSY